MHAVQRHFENLDSERKADMNLYLSFLTMAYKYNFHNSYWEIIEYKKSAVQPGEEFAERYLARMTVSENNMLSKALIFEWEFFAKGNPTALYPRDIRNGGFDVRFLGFEVDFWNTFEQLLLNSCDFSTE